MPAPSTIKTVPSGQTALMPAPGVRSSVESARAAWKPASETRIECRTFTGRRTRRYRACHSEWRAGIANALNTGGAGGNRRASMPLKP
ncbi:hypothetical protein CW304_32875 [Bacillus sp. UFRGS-B20]|nr:hypothetical protein CW304_32875 [Bacillus sp. UFRGS-B20]